MRIYVVGPVTHKDKGKGLAKIVEFPRNSGYTVFNPLERPINHSTDYRDRKKYADKLYQDDEEFIKNKVDIVVADLRGPSDGRTTEQIIARKYGKPVIGYASKPVHSPWSIVHTT